MVKTMSSETARKHSSVPHPRKPADPPEFGHPALNWLGHDLVDLEFGLGSETWARWSAVGFSCGMRLASVEPGHARKLVREWTNGEKDRLLAEMVLPQVGRRPLTVTDELTKIRRVFINLMTEPPEEIQGELARLDPGQHLAWWFRHSIAWGMKAGLDADSLFTGRLLALFDRLPLNQRFISDRLVHIFRAGERPRRPALIELFDYSYPVTPMERRTTVELAGKVLAELSRWGKTLAPQEWILCGFREGLLLSTRNAPLRNRLFAESTCEGMQAVWSLFTEHVGPDAARWQPKQLVAETLTWLRKVHPSLVQPNCRAVEFERIRHLFDFAFWMGLAAGASDGSGR